MSDWKETTLGEVATVSWGDTKTTKSAYVQDGFLAYSASGPDGFLPHADRHGDGVVISAIGAQCGKTWFAQGEWSCIKNTMWFQAGPEADTRFLYYATSEPDRWPKRGAAQPFIGLGDAKLLQLRLPHPDQQRQIASVLGSIDDLIENNRRRVKVLEEMARAIYREWFVRFRYPGHEDVPLVDSHLGPIPDGWEVQRLDEVASLVRGRSYRKHELVDVGGRLFVNLKCMMRGGGFRRDGVKRYDGKFTDAQLVEHGDVVLAVTDLTQGREILARATLVPRLPEPGVISLDVARIVPDELADRLWLFAVLRWSDFADRVKEFANGSTVLHLSPDHVAAGKVLWPPGELRASLVSALEPNLGLVDELLDASDRLALIRDLLLPKLITGQIDVSRVDLDALTEAATA